MGTVDTRHLECGFLHICESKKKKIDVLCVGWIAKLRRSVYSPCTLLLGELETPKPDRFVKINHVPRHPAQGTNDLATSRSPENRPTSAPPARLLTVSVSTALFLPLSRCPPLLLFLAMRCALSVRERAGLRCGKRGRTDSGPRGEVLERAAGGMRPSDRRWMTPASSSSRICRPAKPISEAVLVLESVWIRIFVSRSSHARSFLPLPALQLAVKFRRSATARFFRRLARGQRCCL